MKVRLRRALAVIALSCAGALLPLGCSGDDTTTPPNDAAVASDVTQRPDGGSADAPVDSTVDAHDAFVDAADASQPRDATAADVVDAADATDAVVDTGDGGDAVAPPDASDAATSADADAGSPDGAVPATDYTQVTATIGPQGGTLSHPTGARLVVPAGALADAIPITMTGIDAPSGLGATAVGQGFSLSPAGTRFLTPASLVIPVQSALVPPGTTAGQVHVYTQDPSAQTYVALDGIADLAAGTVTTSISTLGMFVAAAQPSSSALAITTVPPLPNATVATAYSFQFTAGGGTPPYAWSFAPGSSSPPGLSLDGATGILSGTPTTSANFGFYLRVSDTTSAMVQKPFVVDVYPQQMPVPALSALYPNHVQQNDPSTSVALTGTSFVQTSRVYWDGSTFLQTVYVDDTRLTATVPGSLLTTAGSHAITVVNPAPGGGTSAALTFTIDPPPAGNPAPTNTDLSPRSLPVGSPDTVVKLIGTGYIPTTQVVAGSQALSAQYVSATELDVLIPAALLAADRDITFTTYNSPPGGGYFWGGYSLLVGRGDAPYIEPVYPGVVVAGSGDTTLQANGSAVAGGFLQLDQTPLATDTSTHPYTAVIPAALLTNARNADVSYVDPTGYTSNRVLLSIVPAATVPAPVTDIGGPYNQVSPLEVFGSQLYKYDSANAAIAYCTLPGCTNGGWAVTGLGSVGQIEAAGSDLYFSTNTDLRTCPLGTTCNGGTVIASGYSRIVGADASNLYFIVSAPMRSIETLMRCALPCRGNAVPMMTSLINAAAFTSTSVWLTDFFGNIVRCALPDCAGGPQRTVVAPLAGSSDMLSSVASNGDYVYAASGGGNGLYECAASDCPGTLHLLAPDIHQITVADATHLYFRSGGDTIAYCAIPGCPGGPQPLEWGRAGSYVEAQDASNLYFFGYPPGKYAFDLFSVAKP